MSWVREIFVGEKFTTTKGSEIVVTKVESARKVYFKFLDETGYEGIATAYFLVRGQVSNPLERTCAGVGFLGVGPYKIRVNGKLTSYGKKWQSMITRCYREKHAPSYRDKYVCDSWHNFQNFAAWYESLEFKQDSWHLDKDILMAGNKVYSPETCVLIPERLNTVIVRSAIEDKVGVYKTRNGKYRANPNDCTFRVRETWEEARADYLSYKKTRLIK